MGGVVTTPPLWFFANIFFSFQIIFFCSCVPVRGPIARLLLQNFFTYPNRQKSYTPFIEHPYGGGGYHPPPRIFQIKFLPLGVKRYNLVHLVQDT